MNTELITTKIKLEELKQHPRNYRQHPEDQIAHLKESITRHGIYRPLIVSKDKTILAGHGVFKAAAALELKELPCIVLDLEAEEPAALKILTADNEISHLAEINDRQLSEILKEIKELDINGLLGTGWDEMMLSNLVFVSRPAGEIADKNEAASYVGMPEYQSEAPEFRVLVILDSQEAREEFIKMLNVENVNRLSKLWSLRWPERARDDRASIVFEKADA